MSVGIKDCFLKVNLGACLLSVLLIFISYPMKVNAFIEVEDEFEDDVNISAIVDSFQIGYDKMFRPNYGGDPVTVGVSLYVLSISDVSEDRMDFTIDMYFRQF